MSVERIVTKGRARSLLWDGGDLVDVVGGWRRWSSDGVERAARVGWGYPFDQVVASPSGRFHVQYAERATKALVLDDGRIVRELNRSFSHATDYDYPVAVGELPDGREVLAHCPDRYNVLEIEELDSGRRLTRGVRNPVDVFHSRLAFSPEGRHLLMAGWLWHPYGVGWVFDVQQALTDPSTLDGRGTIPLGEAVDAEVGSACWLDGDRVAVGTTAEEPLSGDQSQALGPGQIGVWSIRAAQWLHRSPVEYRIAMMLGCGALVCVLYGHPRLVDPTSGAIVVEWPDIDTGDKEGSYPARRDPSPRNAGLRASLKHERTCHQAGHSGRRWRGQAHRDHVKHQPGPFRQASCETRHGRHDGGVLAGDQHGDPGRTQEAGRESLDGSGRLLYGPGQGP